MIDRRIPFEGIDNFRDFGGYATASGTRLQAGRYFRSAHHAAASDADLEKLAGMSLEVVVDLRRLEERETEPSRRWPGFKAEVVANDIASGLAEWSSFIKGAGDVTTSSWETYLFDWYARALYDERHIDLFRRYFRIVAEIDRPMVVHCTAGKDRTGLICALTHHVAGVHADDIVSDYLLTNNEERVQRLVGLMRGRFQERMGFVPSDETLRTIASVKPGYLQTAFEAARSRHGSLEIYLSEVIGIDSALREQIAARLTAS